MRILFLLTDAFGGHGGIAKFNRDLIHALSSHPDTAEVVVLPRVMANGHQERIPPGVSFRTAGLGGKWRYAMAVADERRGGRFDAVLCGHINLLPIAVPLKWSLGPPLVLMIHGVEAWTPRRNPILNGMVTGVDRFITVSLTTGERFVGWSGLPADKGFLLPNAIDRDRFGPGPKDRALVRRYGVEGCRIIMTLGRLSAGERAKGFDQILELMPRLLDQVDNLAYLVVGDGDDRERLVAKAQALGVGDRVRFTGYVSEHEKAAHYRLADVSVMPSVGEGFGIVHLEAMACGIPVIASKLDGSREAVRGGLLGSVVDPGDPQEILDAILHALDQPKRVPDGIDHYSSEKFEKRVHDFVSSFLKPPR